MIFYFCYLRHRHYHFPLHIFELDRSTSSRFHYPPPLPFPPPSLFSCFRRCHLRRRRHRLMEDLYRAMPRK